MVYSAPGSIIREKRKERGLTLRQVCELLTHGGAATSISNLSRLESDMIPLQPLMRTALARILGFDESKLGTSMQGFETEGHTDFVALDLPTDNGDIDIFRLYTHMCDTIMLVGDRYLAMSRPAEALSAYQNAGRIAKWANSDIDTRRVQYRTGLYYIHISAAHKLEAGPEADKKYAECLQFAINCFTLAITKGAIDTIEGEFRVVIGDQALDGLMLNASALDASTRAYVDLWKRLEAPHYKQTAIRVLTSATDAYCDVAARASSSSGNRVATLKATALAKQAVLLRDVEYETKKLDSLDLTDSIGLLKEAIRVQMELCCAGRSKRNLRALAHYHSELGDTFEKLNTDNGRTQALWNFLLAAEVHEDFCPLTEPDYQDRIDVVGDIMRENGYSSEVSELERLACEVDLLGLSYTLDAPVRACVSAARANRKQVDIGTIPDIVAV